MEVRSRLLVSTVLVALASGYLVSGVALLLDSLQNSWFTWTPPGSTVPRTVFSPYWATLIPSLILIGMGAAATITVAFAVALAGRTRRVLVAFGSANLATGVVLFLHSLSFTFFFVCRDPGGCRAEVLPFWPALLPALVMAGVGITFVLFSRRRQS
ncbi:MAG: hypothetical protein ACE5JE_09045 [Thermoplasmata archaeon]